MVEILEGIEPDDEVLAGCRRLRSEGFTLALDDVSSFSAAEPFLPLASIVKIDLRATDPSHLAPLVKRCRRADLAIVAEKVETIDEFRWCETLGFDYFQGYFLARPSPVPGRALDPGRVAQLRLVGRLLDHECDLAELEGIFRVDPAMTLAIAPTRGHGRRRGMRRTVQTVREALVLAGWRRLQSWVALLLIGGKGQASEEELTTALTRARACELVAEAIGGALTETAFTAGMVSSFDILLGVPLEDVLRELPLDDDVRRATAGGRGPPRAAGR